MLEELERAGVSVFERGWLSSNNVLLHGNDHRGAVVVDTGYWTHADQTVALLRHALRGRPLTRVVNTHLHSDHCGGNAAVQAAFGCTIDVPAGEAAVVDAWDPSILTYDATGQHCPRFFREGVVAAPSTVAAGRWDWEAIASPGHDPLSFALYQPELELLISADALWHNGFGVVFPELEGETAFADVRLTLERFARLRVRHVIPGHGAPFTDMNAAIDRALHRLDGFERDPRMHALHAAKVLIKFRLLETQSETWASLRTWLSRARYFELVRQRYFADIESETWLQSLLTDMADRKALIRQDGRIRNT
ncbi:MAG TPA: MBL fold metallo-hydrolase [Albitalea sp.]|uniref:MBL fold metallo-hydrolase n=1 Tax=Piscinibacter sp. TaxID=1903157 RepID=UPI002ED5B49F